MPPLESCATGEARGPAHAGAVASATVPYGTRRREIVTFSTASWFNERASKMRPRRTTHGDGAGWDDVGKTLYLAYFLEPGRLSRRKQ